MGMRPDLGNNLDVKESIAPAAARANGTVNGSAVDLKEYGGRLSAILHSAAGSGTTPVLAVKLQESDDGSSGWSDISGATFTNVTDAATSLQKIAFDADSAKRYVRAVATITGAAGGGFVFSVMLGLAPRPDVPSPS